MLQLAEIHLAKIPSPSSFVMLNVSVAVSSRVDATGMLHPNAKAKERGFLHDKKICQLCLITT